MSGFGFGFSPVLGGFLPGAVVGPAPLPSPVRAAFVLSGNWNWTGDSTTAGVGADTALGGPEQLHSLITGGGGSVTDRGLSGNTSTQIKDYVTTTLLPAERAKPWIFGGGLNDFPTTLGNIQDWPPTVKANVELMRASLTGGVDWFHMLSPIPDAMLDGTAAAADSVWHRRDMKATYGRHAIDDSAFLRTQGDPSPTGLDYFNVSVNGGIPLTFRSTGGARPAAGNWDNTLPSIADGTVAATNPSLAYNDGRFSWHTAQQKFYIKNGASGAGSWVEYDDKHFAAHGYSYMAACFRDVVAASEGTGAPCMSYMHELKLAKDFAPGVVGNVPYTNAADQVEIVAGNAGGQFSASLSTAVYSGETQPVVVISRTAVGVLSTPEITLMVRLGKVIGGVMRTLDAPVRIYVGRASTQTTPPWRTVASPGIAITGRTYAGFTSGKVFSFAIRVKPTAVTGTRYLLAMNGGVTNSNMTFHLLDGRLVLTGKNAASTTICSAIVTSPNAMVAGNEYWLLCSVDLLNGLLTVYHNDTPVTPAATLTNDIIEFANRMVPRWLCLVEPRKYHDTIVGAQRDAGSAFIGGVGLMMFTTKGYIDWSVAARRRELFNADATFTPVARAHKAAIGGVAIDMELWGDVGDILSGTTSDLTDSQTFSPSYVARNLLT